LNDSKQALPPISSGTSTAKALTIRGTLLPSESWRMSVEVDGEPFPSSSVTLIAKNLRSILSICGFSPEDAISIMLVGHIKPTITATFFAQRKTPVKNGVT
jgi:hypothetical protein